MKRKEEKENNMNICIDIDGTVTEAYYWLKPANQYFGLSVAEKDVTVYDIHQVLGIDRSDYDQFYAQHGVRLHKEAAARTGASQVINWLHDRHWIHFVTARAESMREVSLEWLDANRMPMDSISLLNSHDKVMRAAALNCDLFIEDRYENAIQLAQAGFKVVLINCTYNQGELLPNIKRVNDWFEIARMISQMERRYCPKPLQRLQKTLA